MAKTLRMFLLGAIVALGTGACGGDDDDTTTTGPTTTSGDGDGDGDPCPVNDAVTYNAADDTCELAASLTSPMTEDLTLDAETTWVLTGALVVGDDETETVLTVEAGTTIFGAAPGAFVLIQRSSKIIADGTASEPIVFTSAKEVGSRGPQDWGGLVINGRAPINNGQGDPEEAAGEVMTGTYGGDDPSDDSGILRYVRVEFAGGSVDPENELNGIAFQGVGNGTTVDFVQVNVSSDDGVEFFGGTVNVKHLYIRGADDDSIDWTFGWSGNLQFAAVEQLPESGDAAERGIEADNQGGDTGDRAAMPFSDPVLSNVTLVARGGDDESQGIKLRAGTKGQIWNTIVDGFNEECIDVDETQTQANVMAEELKVQNLVLNCGKGAAQDEEGVDGDAVDLIGRADAKVLEADPLLTDLIPAAGSPALGIGDGPDGAFFDDVDYAGAFDGTTDWRDGWTESAAE